MIADRRLWTASAVIIGLLGVLAVVIRPANHDVSWYLHMAGVMLDGGTAYVDAVDTNPPLIVMLTYLPVWGARLLGLSPAAAFYADVLVLGVLCGLWCSRLVRRAWPGGSVAMHGLITTGIVFLVLAFPKGDFGQREHLSVIFVLPYVLAAAVRSAGGSLSTTEAVIAGVAGAIGFAVKPHFLLAWVAIELVMAGLKTPLPRGPSGTSSLRRPELIAAVSTFAIYAALVVLVFPQYLEVARRVWSVYGGLDSPIARLIALREWQIALVAFALVALVRLPRDLAAPLWIVAAAAAGFLGSSLLQLKGWGYHMLPVQVFLALLFLVFVTSVLQAAPHVAAFIRGGSAAVLAAIALALTGLSSKYVVEARQRPPNDTLTPLVALVREHAPRGPIAVLGMRTLVYPAFPLVNQTGAQWSLRHHSLWFLPAFYEAQLSSATAMQALHTPAQMPPLERAFYEEIVGDLCKLPPKLLVVERPSPQSPAGRRALDLIAYYSQDARFSRLFSGYQTLTDVGPFTVFKASKDPTCN